MNSAGQDRIVGGFDVMKEVKIYNKRE